MFIPAKANPHQPAALVVTANSCAVSDIQNAVDAVKAAGDGVVNIPAGVCDHANQALHLLDGIEIFGAGQGQTLIHNANIRADCRSGGLTGGLRFSGMELPGSSYLELRGCTNFRIDHITIEATSGSAMSVQESHASVIDHSIVKVNGPYYGIVITQGYAETYPEYWVSETYQLLGDSTAIFIEDNEFYGAQHAIVGHGNAHYVARYNHFIGQSGHVIDAHGPGYGPPCGTRLVEAYNNVFDSPIVNWKAFGIRGGSAVIFNNELIDFDNGALLTLESRADEYAPEMRLHDTWIWGNTFYNLGKDYESQCPGNYLGGTPHCNEVFVWNINVHAGLDSLTEIQENREFFLRAPNLQQDGFTYIPYIYPHPLVGAPLPDLHLYGSPDDQMIHLGWEVNMTLPTTTTWTISYEGPAGDEPSPITDLPETTRTYDLNGLNNYTWYTVTLTTDPALLTDTVRVMPTDQILFLPIVQK